MSTESRVSPATVSGMKDDEAAGSGGCTQFCRQFFALVRKNILTKRRSKFQLVSKRLLSFLACVRPWCVRESVESRYCCTSTVFLCRASIKKSGSVKVDKLPGSDAVCRSSVVFVCRVELLANGRSAMHALSQERAYAPAHSSVFTALSARVAFSICVQLSVPSLGLTKVF